MVLASSQALWYLTRATGLVSLVLLTFSVVLGVAEAVRWASPRWPRLVTAGLHKNVSLLVTAFLAIHIVTAVADSFAPIGWLDAVVPFVSRYRPIWVGLGAAAVDLLLALLVTSIFRQRLGYRVWRAVHWAAYACWPVALLHGLGTGSDARIGWALGIQAASLGLVVAAVGWRLATGWNSQDSRRGLGAVLAAVVVACILGFAAIGPLRSGWAQRAGTPTRLLSSSRAAAITPGSSTQSAPASAQQAPTASSDPGGDSVVSVPFSASLNGTLSQSAPTTSGDSTVTIAAILEQGSSATVQVVLRGRAVSGGGIQMRSGSATLGPRSAPGTYQGRVMSLSGTQLRATLRDSAGHRINLSLSLHITEGSGQVSGSASATASATPAGGTSDATG